MIGNTQNCKNAQKKTSAVSDRLFSMAGQNTNGEVPSPVQPYLDTRCQLALSDGIIYKGVCIVVPPTMREHMLRLIHQSHLGMVKSKQ